MNTLNGKGAMRPDSATTIFRNDHRLNPNDYLDDLIEASKDFRKKRGAVWDAARAGVLSRFGLSPEDLERLETTASEWIVVGGAQ